MPKKRILLSIEADRFIVEGVDAEHPPMDQLKVICDRIADRCKVTFSGNMEGNPDDQMVCFPFSKELSEEKWAEVDDFLRQLNDSKLVFQLDFYEVTEAAQEAFRLFNDFIRMENRLKEVPATAMEAWEKLGKALEGD